MTTNNGKAESGSGSAPDKGQMELPPGWRQASEFRKIECDECQAALALAPLSHTEWSIVCPVCGHFYATYREADEANEPEVDWIDYPESEDLMPDIADERKRVMTVYKVVENGTEKLFDYRASALAAVEILMKRIVRARANGLLEYRGIPLWGWDIYTVLGIDDDTPKFSVCLERCAQSPTEMDESVMQLIIAEQGYGCDYLSMFW